MRYLKIVAVFLAIIVIFTSIVKAETREEIAYNLVNEYFKNYQTKDTPADLRLSSYKIESLKIVQETEDEMIVNFSYKIKPKSLSHGWADTGGSMYFRIQNIDNIWTTTEKTTSPMDLSNFNPYADANEKGIVYNLVDNLLKSYMTSEVSDEYRINFYEINKIEIISKNENEIQSSVTVNTLPINRNYSFSNMDKNVIEFTINKIDDEWQITNNIKKSVEHNNFNNMQEVDTNNSSNITFYIVVILLSILVCIIILCIIKLKRNKFSNIKKQSN